MRPAVHGAIKNRSAGKVSAARETAENPARYGEDLAAHVGVERHGCHVWSWNCHGVPGDAAIGALAESGTDFPDDSGILCIHGKLGNAEWRGIDRRPAPSAIHGFINHAR